MLRREEDRYTLIAKDIDFSKINLREVKVKTSRAAALAPDIDGKSEVAGDAKADDGDAIASGKAATPAKSSYSASSAEGSNSVNGSKRKGHLPEKSSAGDAVGTWLWW